MFYGAEKEKLATTYSRIAFRYTTIGETAFHFRVRKGTGWFHCSMATKVEGFEKASALMELSKNRSGSLATVQKGNKSHAMSLACQPNMRRQEGIKSNG